MQPKIIISSLLISAVSATNLMIHPQMKRDLQARQTAGLSQECQSAILGVYESLPTPPPKIVQDAQRNPQTDPCDFTTPASLSKEYASYNSQIESWYSANEDDLSSALSECPILTQYASMIPVCASDITATRTSASTAASVDASTTGTSVGAQTAATETDDAIATESESAAEATSTNAAGRESAMIYAAAAVAGVVAAVL